MLVEMNYKKKRMEKKGKKERKKEEKEREKERKKKGKDKINAHFTIIVLFRVKSVKSYFRPHAFYENIPPDHKAPVRRLQKQWRRRVREGETNE